MLPALLDATWPHVGLVRELSSAAYHGSPGVSHTQLVDFARSPAHYWAMHREAARPVRTETDAMRAGTLAHCLILEPGELPFRYAVGPSEDRRTREWHDFASAHANRIILKPSEMATASAQAASVKRQDDLAKLFAVGEAEVSAYWTDAATGLQCRCRPDWTHPAGDNAVVLTELKTCPDASPAAFARTVAQMRYHWQAALYTDGYSIASGKVVAGFVFVAVEHTYPYAAAGYMLDEGSMDMAREEVADALRRFAACEASGQWPGYVADHIGVLQLPRWYRPAYEENA